MTTTARMLCSGLLVASCLPLWLFLWGFSVDDAWIVSRVVENGLEAGQLSFNLGAERTDAVTALGFAELLQAICGVLGVADAFEAARWLGVFCLASSLAVAGWTALGPSSRRDGEASIWLRALGWVLTAGLSPSLAAWAGAGLEAPLVACLCTLGCAAWERQADRVQPGWERPLGALLLGLALGWRPELVGFVLVAAFQLERTSLRRTTSLRSRLLALLLLAVPALTFASLRFAWFGSALPLALLAKEPDLLSGLRYTVGGLLLCGPLWLLWPLLFGRTPGAKRWLPAFAAHGLCLVLAGGDWMPVYRLWVPVLPWLVGLGVRELRGSFKASAPILGAALASSLLLAAYGAALRQVIPRRQQMVADLRPELAHSRAVAAVDVGWVGRATRAEVIDLGGVTDPRVAALPGGHTSKNIHPGFFAARSVDTWLIRAADRSYVPEAPLDSVHCVYAVDQRLSWKAENLGFRGVATIPLPGTDEQYVVARHQSLQR
jgi:hypothetical protein